MINMAQLMVHQHIVNKPKEGDFRYIKLIDRYWTTRKTLDKPWDKKQINLVLFMDSKWESIRLIH